MYKGHEHQQRFVVWINKSAIEFLKINKHRINYKDIHYILSHSVYDLVHSNMFKEEYLKFDSEYIKEKYPDTPQPKRNIFRRKP